MLILIVTQLTTLTTNLDLPEERQKYTIRQPKKYLPL